MANKTVTVLLKAITGAYRAEMTKAAAATAQVGAAARTTGAATGRLPGILGPTGAAALKVAAGFAAVGGLTGGLYGSAKAAIDFEANFTRVRKTVDGSERQLQAIAGEFRGMAREMPATTAEITAVGEAAGQLGVSRAGIVDFTDAMVKMGVTTTLTADEAAFAFARISNIMQTPEAEIENLAAATVHLGNNFAATEGEITDMAVRLAGAAHVVGLTEADVLALATSLSAVGQKAEAGGSAFSRVMLTIEEAVQTGSAELGIFADVAETSASSFAQTWQENPQEAILQFIAGLGSMIESGENVVPVLQDLELNEIRVRRALLDAAGASDTFADATRQANGAYEEAAALDEEYAKFAETTASKIQVLKNNVVDFGITLGTAMKPAIDETIDALSQFISSTNEGVQTFQRVINELGEADPVTPTDRFRDSLAELDAQTVQTIPGIQNLTAAQQDAAAKTAIMNRRAQEAADVLANLPDGTRPAEEGMLALEGSMERAAQRAEMAAERTEELSDAQGDLVDDIRTYLDPMTAFEQALEDQETAAREAAEAAEEAADKSGDSWEDYFNEVKPNITNINQALEEQIEDYRNWKDNLVAIAERAGPEIAEQLALLGPEAAQHVAAIADSSDPELEKFIDLMRERGQLAGAGWVTKMDEEFGMASRRAALRVDEMFGAIDTETEAGLRRAEEKMAGYPDIVHDHLQRASIVARDRAQETADNVNEEMDAGQRYRLERDAEARDAFFNHWRDIRRTGREGADETMGEVNTETQEGLDVWEDKLDGMSPYMREEQRKVEARARYGARATYGQINTETEVGKREWERKLSGMPPGMRSTMRTVEDRGDEGSRRTHGAINSRASQGVLRWARIVDGYVGSLEAGLNPVAAEIGGKTFNFPNAAAARFAARYSQASGDIMERSRDSAHITNQMSVVYGEPETGGEAYIPLSPAKRPRSRMIANETVARLGGQVTWMQEGGFTEPSKVPRPRQSDGSKWGDVAELWMKLVYEATKDWVEENMAPQFEMISGAGVRGGWRTMWKALSRRFPTAQLFSAYRPGAITATGNRSYHGMGRAIDVSPWRNIAEWIIQNYMRQTREMIFSPMGSRQVHNGRFHYYSGITRAQHFDHVHWAMETGGILAKFVLRAIDPVLRKYRDADMDMYLRGGHFDRGGVLRPGVTVASNTTGSNEVVAAEGMIRNQVHLAMQDGGLLNYSGMPRSSRSPISSKRMTPEQYELAVRHNNARFELGLLSVEDHLYNLGERLLRYVPYSDEWMAIFREREQTLQGILNDATQAYEEALAKQKDAFSALNSLLDERDQILESMEDAEKQYNDAVTDATERRNERLLEAERQFDEQRRQIIEGRASGLFGSFDPQQRAERVWANTIGAVTRNIRSQVEDFERWASGIDLLRELGLSEEAIALLGLDEFTSESLATVQMWSNATQDEIDALNTAVLDRQGAANDRAASEAELLLGEVGRALIQLTEQTGEQIDEINAEYQESIDEFAAELADTMESLQGDLQSLGQDTGRTYAEALAEGLNSGIPGIVAAAEQARAAMSATAAAQRELTAAENLVASTPVAGQSGSKAPLGRAYNTKNMGLMLRMSDASWWDVERSAEPYVKKLWGPVLWHPAIANDRPEGLVIRDLFGPGTLQRFTVPNPQPRYFAQGGFISKPMVMGEAGMERVRIDPLTMDRMTPHERRMERKLDALISAVREADGDVYMDGRKISEIVSHHQLRRAGAQRIAQGSGAWRSS